MAISLFYLLVWILPFSFFINSIYLNINIWRIYYLIQFILIIYCTGCLLQFQIEQVYFYWSPLSLILILCTLILSLACYIIIEFRIDTRIRLLHFCIFLIQALSITFFSIQNLFIFYILFELVLIPFFLIIITWGSPGKNIKAALYFFFYTYIASLPMLFSIIYIFIEKNEYIIYNLFMISFEPVIIKILWSTFFLAFAAKLAVPPLHLWLVEAHVEAPTVGSVLLSGIALKLGLFGYLTILPILFSAVHLYMQYILYPVLLVLFIYIVLIFLAQMDLKKIIAYLSIIHMVFILLGLFTNTLEGFQGGILMAITHSFVSPALFCCVGFIYDRYENRSVINFSGLTRYMPILSIFVFFLFLIEIGFPLTINFIGELLILKGIFDYIHYFIFLLSVPYILLAAIIFKTFNKMFFGPVSYELTLFTDITFKEIGVLSILSFPLISFFLVPQLLLDFGDFIFQMNRCFLILQ